MTARVRAVLGRRSRTHGCEGIHTGPRPAVRSCHFPACGGDSSPTRRRPAIAFPSLAMTTIPHVLSLFAVLWSPDLAPQGPSPKSPGAAPAAGKSAPTFTQDVAPIVL